jgi:hypothetical protein
MLSISESEALLVAVTTNSKAMAWRNVKGTVAINRDLGLVIDITRQF